MHNALLGRAGEHRLGRLHGGDRGLLVSTLDRFLDPADLGAHAGAARLIDDGLARDPAGRFRGGCGVSHKDLVRFAMKNARRRGSRRLGLCLYYDGLKTVNLGGLKSLRHAFGARRIVSSDHDRPIGAR